MHKECDWYFVAYLKNGYSSQSAKLDLNEKWFQKQKTIRSYIFDAQGFRKTRNENPPMQEIGVTSYPVPADLPLVGRLAGMG